MGCSFVKKRCKKQEQTEGGPSLPPLPACRAISPLASSCKTCEDCIEVKLLASRMSNFGDGTSEVHCYARNIAEKSASTCPGKLQSLTSYLCQGYE